MSDSELPVNPDHLNIASIAACTRALGPGKRAVIWVQGCPLNCRGCVAPDWIPFVPANLLRPDEVLAQLDLDLITGLTFSGGEPMEQAAGLGELVLLARKQKDLDLICFTGYRYERLLANPPNTGVPQLLREVDVLIDGPFVEALSGSVGLRGSSNQRIIHLTSRLKEHNLETDQRKIEITIRQGELVFIGIPTPGILSVLQNAGPAVSERME